MSGLFAFLLFLSLLSLLIGLIKPSVFKGLSKKDITRKKVATIFGITSFVLFFAFGFTVDTVTDIQGEQDQQVNKNSNTVFKEGNISPDKNQEEDVLKQIVKEDNVVLDDNSETNNEQLVEPEEDQIIQEPNPPTEPAPQTTRKSVLALLKDNALSEWGEDYEMVQYEYNNQVEAYDWVVAQTKYPDIMNNALQEWGDDYEMVQYEYNNQVEAYEWIMEQTEYPDIMNNALQEWGDDYEMVQYEYNNQVEAYNNL